MSAPVKYTCPDIDAVQKTILANLQYLSKLELNGEDADLIDDVCTDLRYIADRDLEDLRNSNSRLRDWGEKLESTLSDKEEEIEQLEIEIRKLKDMIE